MSNNDIDMIVESLKKQVEANFPTTIEVPTADDASEEEASRFVQKQFEDAGFDCPAEEALDIVRQAREQAE